MRRPAHRLAALHNDAQIVCQDVAGAAKYSAIRQAVSEDGAVPNDGVPEP
jgi:hypothetical protein